MQTIRHATDIFCRAPIVVLAFLVCVVGACAGGDDEQPPQQPDFASAESSWSIHVFVGEGTDRRRVDVTPVKEVSAPTEAAAQTSASPLTTKSNVDGADGGVTLVDDVNVASGWALVWGAAIECGLSVPASASAIDPTVTVPPWAPRGGWYIFQTTPQTCDAQLRDEEALLCIADKLTQVADAVVSVDWPTIARVPASRLPAGFPKGPWSIPPQADKDRFIARDLAINVLGHVSRLDGKAVPGAPYSCARIYGQAANDLAFARVVSPLLYDVPTQDGVAVPAKTTYPPPLLPIVSANLATLALSRLAFEEQILRASGHLLHDTIRKDVYSDIGGALQRSGAALDSLRGNQIAWGLADNANGPYNALPHAIRVLTGRWEMGPRSPDPACSGIPALQTLNAAYSDDASARILDLPLATTGQSTAVQIVENAGIVLPQTALAGPTAASAAALKNLLRDQLTGEAAAVARLDPHDPVLSAKLGVQAQGDRGNRRWHRRRGPSLRLREVASHVSDDDERSRRHDLAGRGRFGGRAAFGAQGPVFRGRQRACGGGNGAGCCGRSRGSSDGCAGANGGIERSRAVQRDRRGAYRNLCGHGGHHMALGTRSRRSVRALDFSGRILHWAGSPASSRHPRQPGRGRQCQRRGHCGGARRRGRLRSWAGPGRVIMLPPDTTPQSGGTTLLFAGFEPDDLGGITTEANAVERLLLVYGPPWVAECAAGVRQECPMGFEADYVLRPRTASITTDPAFKDYMGVVNPVLGVTFNTTAPPPKFRTTPKSRLDNEHMYVIVERDAKAPGTRGIVLGSLLPRIPEPPARRLMTTSFVYSAMKRELLEAVIGLGEKSTIRSASIGMRAATVGPGYCVDGLRWDLFVPLENELTSDSDGYENSWRHYLNLAKISATRADQLGQELISLGLQRDLRREAAGELLADLCGESTAMQTISIDEDAKVVAPKDSESLSTCLGEARTDVVFFSDDPTLGMSDSAKGDFLRGVLNCAGIGSSNPLCKRLLAGEKLKVQGLSLAPPPPPVVKSDCSVLKDARQSLVSGFSADVFSNALAEPFGDGANLQSLGRSLRMTVGTKGDWDVTNAGALVMSSVTDGYWPACQKTGATAPCPSDGPAATLRDIFRQCGTPGDRQVQPLGACEGTTELGELTALRWRVEGALWLLAAAEGGIPEGMFRTPIPAWNGLTAASVPGTVWSRSSSGGDWRSFERDPARPPYYQLLVAGSTATTEESRRMLAAQVDDVDPAWLRARFDEMPWWYGTVYGAGVTPYLHAGAINHEMVSNFVTATRVMSVSGGFDATTGKGFLSSEDWKFLGGKANKYDCPTAWSTPTHFDARHGLWELHGRISTLKRNVYFPSDRTSVAKARGIIYSPDDASGTSAADGLISAFRTSIAASSGGRRDLDRILFDSRRADQANWWQEMAYVFDTFATDDTLPAWTDNNYSIALSNIDPDERVIQFVNSQPPRTPCGAASQMLGAMALACESTRTLTTSDGSIGEPPTLASAEDIVKLETWLNSIEKVAKNRLGRLYAESVPDRVVADIRASSSVSGTKLGQHGDKVVEMEQAFTTLTTAWRALPIELAQIRGAIAGARLRLSGVDIADRKELLSLEIQELRIHAQMVQAVGSFVASFSSISSGPTGFLNAVGTGVSSSASIGFGIKELEKTEELKDLAKDGKANSVAQVLNDLRVAVTPIWGDVEKTSGTIRSTAAQIAEISSQVDRLEKKAQYEAAKGSGAEFYTDPSGAAVSLPVNAVLNRQYDAVEIRYRRALEDAKRLSYMARRAIEQRIGIKLTEIDTKVGPMDPPKSWADKLCRLQGIDYARLRQTPGIDAGAGKTPSPELGGEFADQFIGDYVTQLESFVEYYNLQYPSHDADDTTVLSLKDDLLTAANKCVYDAPNLLFYSGRLSQTVDPTVLAPADLHRWRLSTCEPSADRCLRVLDGKTLIVSNPAHATDPTASTEIPLEPPPDSPRGGVTWLVDVAPSAFTSSGPGAVSEAPSGLVSQAVKLEPGSYVLSWWDQARALDGGYTSPVTARYSGGAFAADWSPIASVSEAAYLPPADGKRPWGPRRSVAFTVSESGTYHIAFAASIAPTIKGSVAIANVQLETVSPGATAGPYYDTEDTRAVVSGLCTTRSGADLRAQFDHMCDSVVGCYYELRSGILIDTKTLTDPASSLAGKLAKGNFNFRHIDVSLNLVGTGVHDCSTDPTPTCYGSGFIEYSLVHDATNAGVLRWENASEPFDFSIGRIEHGKALAAERYITLPIGSADASLLAQPGISKPEFRGRPLDGDYRLRIWESSALRFNRLEDVQIVLHSRYWSRVDRQSVAP